MAELKQCACGNKTHDPAGVCATCRFRLKGAGPTPTEKVKKMPGPKSKYSVCPECGKKFSDESWLSAHRKKEHSGEAPDAERRREAQKRYLARKKEHSLKAEIAKRDSGQAGMTKEKEDTMAKCKIDGCEKYVVKKGMCTRHFKESMGLHVGRKKKSKPEKDDISRTRKRLLKEIILPPDFGRIQSGDGHLTLDLSAYPKTFKTLTSFAPKDPGGLLAFLLKDDLARLEANL
ncbi:MAG: hypothetical protein Q8J64_06440 [Thermodesulfovibrionales bacterium]|nr:hypothetical protein [Thermodesulfovibrionales bacterium]